MQPQMMPRFQPQMMQCQPMPQPAPQPQPQMVMMPGPNGQPMPFMMGPRGPMPMPMFMQQQCPPPPCWPQRCTEKDGQWIKLPYVEGVEMLGWMEGRGWDDCCHKGQIAFVD